MSSSCARPGFKVLPCSEYDKLIARLNSAESGLASKASSGTKAKAPGAVKYFKKTKTNCDS